MASNQKKNPCRSCAALLLSSANDNPPKAHEYLVAVGTSAIDGNPRYACLICNTALVESKQSGARWSLAE